MGFNFGAFGGGLSQGVNNGMALGASVQAQIDAQNIRDLQKQGMEEAQQARQDYIDKSISTSGLHGATDPQTATDNASAAAANSSPALGGLMAGMDASQAPAAQMAQPQTDVSAKGSAPQFSTTAPTYSVDGKEMPSYDDARATAEQKAPATMDMFIKHAVPKVAAAYLAQGDAQKAQAWNDWADQTTNKQNMRTWAQAYQAAQMGDMDTATDKMVDLYKHVDDGISVTSKKAVVDKDGKSHYEIGLKDDKSGREWTQQIDARTLLEQGMVGLSPDKQFEMRWKRQTDADTARAKAASEAASKAADYGYKVKEKGVDAKYDAIKDNRKQKFEIEKQDRAHGDAVDLANVNSGNRQTEEANKTYLETANIGAKEKAKVSAKMDALKAAGYDDDAIRGMMPMLLNAESYKKPTSPGEARRMAFDARMKGDFAFSRKSAAEQNQIIDGDIAIINGGGGIPASAPAKRGTAPNPAASGISAPAPASTAAPAKAAGKGVPVYDSQTGKIVYR